MIVQLVADWRQGMLTIGSTPDPGALHLTQGVVRVGGVSVIFSTIYIRIRILIYAYIYTHTYFCIFMSVLEALQFYIALHIHSQHIHILHIFQTVLDMLDTIHMLDTLGTNYITTMLVQGINKPTQCVTPPWDAHLLICSFLGTILRLRFLLKDFPGLDCV